MRFSFGLRCAFAAMVMMAAAVVALPAQAQSTGNVRISIVKGGWIALR